MKPGRRPLTPGWEMGRPRPATAGSRAFCPIRGNRVGPLVYESQNEDVQLTGLEQLLPLLHCSIRAQIGFLLLGGGSMSSFERLLEPGCTEGAACRCGEEMEIASIERLPEGSDADVRSTIAARVTMRCG
jgi:hypothetical protein